MKKNLLVATILSMICFLMPVSGTLRSASYSLNVPNNGAIKHSFRNMGIYTGSWNFGEYDAETIAKTFDMSQSWFVSSTNNYSQKMNQAHTINPNYKALVYRNVICIYDYWPDEWNYANSQGWLLKDAQGNYVVSTVYPDNYLVDITNARYQAWLGAKVKSWLDQYSFFSGVMADCSLMCNTHQFESNCSSRPINPQTGTYFTDQEILDGCVGVLNAIIDSVGSSKIVLANGIWSGFSFANPAAGANYRYVLSRVPRLNAVFSEGAFLPDTWFTETQWKQSVDMVTWMQDNFLAGHSERYFVGGSRFDPGEQDMVYRFCSMLLAVKYSSQNLIYFGDISGNATLITLAQKLRSVDMSNPLGDYYEINQTSVYTRDFVNGKVLVNPTNVSQTVTLDGSYTTLDGNIASGSLTLNSYTGVILFK